MMKCVSCGVMIDESSRYCKTCGAKQHKVREDSVGEILEDALDTTVRVTKTVAKEGYRVTKKVARKIKNEVDIV